MGYHSVNAPFTAPTILVQHVLPVLVVKEILRAHGEARSRADGPNFIQYLAGQLFALCYSINDVTI